MKKLLGILLFSLSAVTGFAQVPNYSPDYVFIHQVGIGKEEIQSTDPSAWLEIGKNGTNKGVIIPRVNDTLDIASPVKGLVIFLNADSTIRYYTKYWKAVGRQDLSAYLTKAEAEGLYLNLENFGDSLSNYIDTSQIVNLGDSTILFVTPSQMGDSIPIDTVSTIEQLEDYTGRAFSIIVTDSLRGGVYYKSTDALTADDGVIFNAQGGGFWVRDISQTNSINIKWYGAVGDSVTNSSSAFSKALVTAKNKHMALYIPSGQYVVSNNNSFNMNGCTGLLGTGTLDISNFPDLDSNYAAFLWEGKVDSLTNVVAVSTSSRNVQLAPGLNLKRGDILFFVSFEHFYGYDGHGYKGFRAHVGSYDNSSGSCQLTQFPEYDISEALVFLNQPDRIYLDGISVRAADNQRITGFQINFDKVYISSVEVYNTGIAAIAISSSLAYINNYSAYNTYSDKLGQGYGVAINGLSYAELRGVNIHGSRHAFKMGDDGLWGSFLNGPDGGPYFYPANAKIFGGTLSNRKDIGLPCLDTHGISGDLYVNGTTINGGVNLAAKSIKMVNCEINTENEGKVNLGRDHLSSYGSYTIDGCKLTSITTNMTVVGDIDDLNISNSKMVYNSTYTGNYSFLVYNDYSIESINIDGLYIDGGQSSAAFSINCTSSDYLKNIEAVSTQIDTHITDPFSLENISVTNSKAFGMVLNGDSSIWVKNVNVKNSYYSGIYGRTADSLFIDNSYFENNGYGGTSDALINGVRISTDGYFSMSNSIIKGSDIAIYNGSSNYRLVDNDLRHNGTTINSEVGKIQQYGNLSDDGLSDDYVTKAGNANINGTLSAYQYFVSDLNTAPASATAPGTKGEIRVTADYIYVCVDTDTWVRCALETW